MDLTLRSTAFQHGEMIPRIHTCQGEDLSPPLSIAGVPAGARGLALIVDDPDAPNGTWDHWIVYDISPGTATIPENSVPPGARVGNNGWDKREWGGPCPPGGRHRYRFKLYALDAQLDLAEGANSQELEAAMEGHILADALLVGFYEKS